MNAMVKDSQIVEILLVEDNPGDVLLTKEAFSEGRMKNNITVASDGEQAMEILRKEGIYSDAVVPDIILLDLNLPKKDGREVLAEIKGDDELRRIPTLILSSSMAERDIKDTYDLHANSYMVKPHDLDIFADVVNAVEDYWFTSVILPN